MPDSSSSSSAPMWASPRAPPPERTIPDRAAGSLRCAPSAPRRRTPAPPRCEMARTRVQRARPGGDGGGARDQLSRKTRSQPASASRFAQPRCNGPPRVTATTPVALAPAESVQPVIAVGAAAASSTSAWSRSAARPLPRTQRPAGRRGPQHDGAPKRPSAAASASPSSATEDRPRAARARSCRRAVGLVLPHAADLKLRPSSR